MNDRYLQLFERAQHQLDAVIPDARLALTGNTLERETQALSIPLAQRMVVSLEDHDLIDILANHGADLLESRLGADGGRSWMDVDADYEAQPTLRQALLSVLENQLIDHLLKTTAARAAEFEPAGSGDPRGEA